MASQKLKPRAHQSNFEFYLNAIEKNGPLIEGWPPWHSEFGWINICGGSGVKTVPGVRSLDLRHINPANAIQVLTWVPDSMNLLIFDAILQFSPVSMCAYILHSLEVNKTDIVVVQAVAHQKEDISYIGDHYRYLNKLAIKSSVVYSGKTYDCWFISGSVEFDYDKFIHIEYSDITMQTANPMLIRNDTNYRFDNGITIVHRRRVFMQGAVLKVIGKCTLAELVLLHELHNIVVVGVVVVKSVRLCC